LNDRYFILSRKETFLLKKELKEEVGRDGTTSGNKNDQERSSEHTIAGA